MFNLWTLAQSIYMVIHFGAGNIDYNVSIDEYQIEVRKKPAPINGLKI